MNLWQRNRLNAIALFSSWPQAPAAASAASALAPLLCPSDRSGPRTRSAGRSSRPE
ncbi:exported protein of unknown function [Methylorubrum extorquens]|uniref:Uncharacterized protein n=1 Tax=Methylorubrum extorquens TaxID=408 RepID=A0A2N9AWZ0_METEX|nr:exported protein of unknown function [Methylorubrum extorquens]